MISKFHQKIYWLFEETIISFLGQTARIIYIRRKSINWILFSPKNMNVSSSIATSFEFECEICDRLWLWGYPIILVFGLVGNALCIEAFAAHKLRPETRLLCSLLAAFDLTALLLSFVTRWFDTTLEISLLNMHRVLCHLITIANYWIPELAAWTLVGISFERALSGMNLFHQNSEWLWIISLRENNTSDAHGRGAPLVCLDV